MNDRFSEELFLTNETGKMLYHKYAEHMPIIDYHCHIDPQAIAEDHVFADNILISLVIRMYRDRRISKKRLRTRCRDLKETVCSYDRIFDMPEMSFLLFMLYLCI